MTVIAAAIVAGRNGCHILYWKFNRISQKERKTTSGKPAISQIKQTESRSGFSDLVVPGGSPPRVSECR